MAAGNSEGGFAPLPKPPPRNRCAGKAGARTSIAARALFSDMSLTCARSIARIGERLARERRDAQDGRRKLGGGLRPPSETSPQESLRRQSRRSNLDRRTRAVLGHVPHLRKVNSTDRRTACARRARRAGWPPETRRGASPPFRNLPPGIVAPAKPALEPRSPHARCSRTCPSPAQGQ